MEEDEALKITEKYVGYIVHQYLGMQKLFSELVPRELRIDQQQQQIVDQKSLKLLKYKESEFVFRNASIILSFIHYIQQREPITKRIKKIWNNEETWSMHKCNKRINHKDLSQSKYPKFS